MKKKTLISAFTLVELMVALSIYVIMSVLLLANQDKFNDSLAFSNLGYDIALTIRQAQTYGSAVSACGTLASCSNANFLNDFGVHFDITSPNSFRIFSEPIQTVPSMVLPLSYADCINASQNGGCGGLPQNGGGPHPVSTYNLQNGYTISGLYDVSDQSTPLGSLDIIFQRPNTNAFIFKNGVDGVTNLVSQGAAIQLQSPTGETEDITIFPSGDIEVGSTIAGAAS